MPETTHGADADSLHMRTHAPPGYACPLCRVAAGAERDAVVHEDEHLLVALSLHQKERNPGSLLVFPRAHVENIHTTPPALLAALHTTARTMARALTQALSADGVTIVQNNAPAGGRKCGTCMCMWCRVMPGMRSTRCRAR